MLYYREKIVGQMQEWVGAVQGDDTHKLIVDTYNSHKPLARGYKLKYSDAWCAGTVSAASIACGYADIFPLEVSCTKMIEKAKAMGIWEERDDFAPLPGDLIIYDWEDNGVGDCIGQPNHVGCVERVEGGIITVIEGNKGNTHTCARRTLKINARYIRGYVCPKYDSNFVKKQTVYIVQPGDNLSRIAARYGMTVDEIVELNKKKHPSLLVNKNVIFPKWELIIKE